MNKALASITCIFALSLVLCPNVTFGATLNVPTPAYPTIQNGIDAAIGGDIVLVADGTYTGVGNKNLNFGGKAITVQSQNGPENCIIDCEHDGRGFNFFNVEREDSVVSGFTITNGFAENGGGIRCEPASPTITNCNISGNEATGDGGGIYGDGALATLTITNCNISGNNGNGVDLQNLHFAISGCTVSENNGGMSIGFTSWGSINNCTVIGNDSYGMNLIDIGSSPISITNCTILENTGVGLSGTFVYGLVAADCTISGNSGNGIFWSGASGTFTNCMITGNEGAGIYYIWNARLTLANCTVSGNREYGISCLWDSIPNDPIITNSILWDNSPGEIFLDVSHPPITVTYSDIQGGYPGDGNIDENPLFANPENDNYHLTADSLCIDVGTSEGAPDHDIDGESRPFGYGIDIGADEYVPMCQGNFDFDNDVDGADAFTFKMHFGRSTFKNPCPADGPAPVEKTWQTTSVVNWDDGYCEKGVAWPTPRFTILYHYFNGAIDWPCDPNTVECENPSNPLNDIVLDNLTGLYWTRNASWENVAMSWSSAIDHAHGVGIGAYNDWRLPNVKELQSLIDFSNYNPALPSGHPFVNMQSNNYYWTSTIGADGTDDAWRVGLYNGAMNYADIWLDVCYVWAVRGGH